MAYTSEIEKLERRWSENPLGLTFAPLAEAYRKAGDHGRALELLDIGLAQHPNYVPAHIVRGRCHLDVNASGEAELAFLRVAELDPENVIALKSLADLCERTGRHAEAIQRLQMLLDVDRANEEARHQLDRLRSASPQDRVATAPPPSAASRSEAQGEPVRESEAPVSRVEGLLEDEGLADITVIVPEELAPSRTQSEFQLPSDAETLQPSSDRLEDIVLGSEIPDHSLPMAESAAGLGMIAPPDANAAAEQRLSGADVVGEAVVPESEAAKGDAAYQPPPLPDEEAFAPAWAGSVFEPARPEADHPPPPEAEPVSAEAVAEVEAETAAPLSSEPEWMPGREPEVAPAEAAPVEAEESPAVEEPIAVHPPVEEPVMAAAATEPPDTATAEVESEAPEAPAPEPELVVTETMAEVFLRQGHRELALAVYLQLSQRDPENRRVAEAAERLRSELEPPPPSTSPAPRYDAAATGGTSVGRMLDGLLGAARPAVAATVHPPAFEPPGRSAGEPTRPARDSLSLSAVFGEESGPVGPVSPPAASSESEPSFDEFFAPEATPPLPSSSAAPEAAAAPTQSGEDLEQFNAWLRGLKR